MILAMLGLLASFAQAGDFTARGAAPTSGLYLNSEGSPLFPLIESAHTSLDIEIYTMTDKALRGELRSAITRGVKIRVIKDPSPVEEKCDLFFGSDSKPETSSDLSADCVDQRKLVTQIKAANGEFVPYNKSALCPNGGGNNGTSCFEHGKIVIADQQTLLVSTGNFDSDNLCIASESPSQCNRDWTLINTDETTVQTVEKIFSTDLLGNSYDVKSIIPDSLENVLTVSPFSLSPLVAFIESANESIDIETQYLKDPDINNALIAAAKKGRKVSVTVASIAAFGTPRPSDKSQTESTYGAFDAAGISSMMFDRSDLINGVPGYMHAKAIVVDGTRAWVGSANGSTTSLTQNREYGLFFDDSSMVEKLLTVIREDHSNPASETWQESLACKMDSCKGDSGGDSGDDSTKVGKGSEKPEKPVKPSPVSTDPKPPKKPKKPKRPPPSA
jgi:cardiolipin synthase